MMVDERDQLALRVDRDDPRPCVRCGGPASPRRYGWACDPCDERVVAQLARWRAEGRTIDPDLPF